ncbi:MAG: hypothetical protein V7L04_06480 [Nostoc sp.]|uniref:hypothetical protein n=1 Tax=Nostoc sp. TaxID=1180 RepID=UPI002FF5AD69
MLQVGGADGSCFSQGETLREQAGKPVQRTASPTHWLPYKGRGVRFKASLLLGERFGERSNCVASKQEPLYMPAAVPAALTFRSNGLRQRLNFNQ